jgi:hypothetical protein
MFTQLCPSHVVTRLTYALNSNPRQCTSILITGSSASTGSVALWMIGWDQFVRETRHAACVQVVTLLHKSLAGEMHIFFA